MPQPPARPPRPDRGKGRLIPGQDEGFIITSNNSGGTFSIVAGSQATQQFSLTIRKK